MKKWGLVCILLLRAATHGQNTPLSPNHPIAIDAQVPFLTGPLISPVGKVVPFGNFMIKSYLYSTIKTGTYNKNWHIVPERKNFYSINGQFFCFFGLTPWCDINIIPQFIYNTVSDQHSFHIGDFIAGLDFQLLSADRTSYFPGIKFAIREVFPTGNFQFFHPKKLSTDHSGDGTFATQMNLIFYKEFHLFHLHWLSTTFSVQYTVNTPVNVHGFNAYGGGFGTKGKVIPGNQFQSIMSFEVTLNQNWVLALDNVYTHTDSSEFWGVPGITFNGTYANPFKPSSEQMSLAPAIEYNFSRDLGIIAGCWFSILGRNSSEFRSGVVNFKYTY